MGTDSENLVATVTADLLSALAHNLLQVFNYSPWYHSFIYLLLM